MSFAEHDAYWRDEAAEKHCGNRKVHGAHRWGDCSLICVTCGHVGCARTCPGTQKLPKAKAKKVRKEA